MTALDLDIPPRTPAPAPRRRPLSTRLSTGHVVMILAGLLAALANLALVRSSDRTVPVLVARDDLAIGVTVTPDLLRSVDVRLGDDVLATLVTPDLVSAGGLDGMVTTAAIPAGSLLRRADLRPTATDLPDQRRIAIPVREELAVGGAVEVDDRIDVIQVVDGVPRYVVAGARVLARADHGGAGLGATSSFFVTIGVDAETALCLASAIEQGGLTIVLSTGVEPVPTSPCTYPTTTSSAPGPDTPSSSSGPGTSDAAGADAASGDGGA